MLFNSKIFPEFACSIIIKVFGDKAHLYSFSLIFIIIYIIKKGKGKNPSPNYYDTLTCVNGPTPVKVTVYVALSPFGAFKEILLIITCPDK